jgi:hypothetical protein
VKEVDTCFGDTILVTCYPDIGGFLGGARTKLGNRVHGAQISVEMEDNFSGPCHRPIGVFIISLRNMSPDENG